MLVDDGANDDDGDMSDMDNLYLTMITLCHRLNGKYSLEMNKIFLSDIFCLFHKFDLFSPQVREKMRTKMMKSLDVQEEMMMFVLLLLLNNVLDRPVLD